jgi:hypothetical protein
MRKLLLCSFLAAAALVPTAPAGAYEGPWCMRASIGRGSVSEICHFRTFQACSNERTLWGSTAFCSQNPRFLPYWQGRGFDQQPRRVSRKIKHRR